MLLSECGGLLSSVLQVQERSVSYFVAHRVQCKHSAECRQATHTKKAQTQLIAGTVRAVKAPAARSLLKPGHVL
jgi:hypothetical protein